MLTKEAKEVLVNLADDLDNRGFGEEATMVDSVIQQDSGLEALIVSLNADLALEYSAMLQYIQHAAVVDGAEFDSVRKELNTHADEEHDHAVEIADKINFLGGIPTTNVGPIKTSPEAPEMLMQDAEGEKDAIRRYKERIEQATALKEFGIVEMLQKVLAKEEEHLNDLVTTLGIKTVEVSVSEGVATSPPAPLPVEGTPTTVPMSIITPA
jgi:bacterioferritin